MSQHPFPNVRPSRWIGPVALVALLAGLGQIAAGQDGMVVRPSRVTGQASFVTGSRGAIAVTLRAGQQRVGAMDFLVDSGHLFGITDPAKQLALDGVDVDYLGHTRTSYRQVHQGVPVFSGVLRVHQNQLGQIVAVNGDFYPSAAKVNTVPTLDAAAARRIAEADLVAGHAATVRSELVIVDTGWYGDAPSGVRLAYHLVLSVPAAAMVEAYFVDAHNGLILDRWSMIHRAKVRRIHDSSASNCCVGHSGTGCDDGICEADVCDFDDYCCVVEWDELCAELASFFCGVCALPGPLARGEGDPPTGIADVDAAYDYYGDVYDYFDRGFGRDSMDDQGLAIVATVNSPVPGCPNAFWSPFLLQMVFCQGLVVDDVVGHELTHGLTQFTANLIYQNQSGQLNESYSDVFGELIDLFNGDAAFAGPPGGTSWPDHPTGPGTDTPNNLRTGCSFAGSGYADGVRWLIGEDVTAFGGAIRDMWDPTCFGDPDQANSSLQVCSPFDVGGVHSGSGVPNHAFALAVDGGGFNGYTITGIGPIKAGAVWYRALSVYLTPASDFEEAYAALNQAAADLVGTTPDDPRTGQPSDSAFDAADAAAIDQALLATEMHTPGRCGQTVNVLDSDPPVLCDASETIFEDDFEGGAGDWTVANTGPPTPYDWELTTEPMPYGRPGTGWFCADPNIGDCFLQDESALHSLTSPGITLTAAGGGAIHLPRLSFSHFVATEPLWDGGNLSISVNAGPFTLVPISAFQYNGYNAHALATAATGNTNPLAGEPGFTGAGGQWGTSLVKLDGLAADGDEIRFRFDFGKDGCTGLDGWYLDDFRVYHCPTSGDCNSNGVADEVELAAGGAVNYVLRNPPVLGAGNYADADSPNGTVVEAENFFLPHPQTLTSIKIWGGYFPNNQPTNDDFTVIFHDDVDGLPGPTLATFSSVPVDHVATGESLFDVDIWEITLTLSGGFGTDGVDLGPGAYFVEIYNNTVGNADGFFWAGSEYLGTQGFVTALEAPGTSWFFGGTYDLAIEITAGVLGTDCDANGILDECEPLDCNTNGTLDACDVLSGASNDVNSNGVPDECDQCVTSATCDDGIFCNGSSSCVSAICVTGTAPCTNQFCDEAADTCVDCLDDAHCDDGAYCNGAETCSGGACAAGTDPCPDRFCDEGTDSCLDCTADSHCEDGVYCNGPETCVDGGCVAGAGPCPVQACDESEQACFDSQCNIDGDCADDDVCTTDTCQDDRCFNTAIEDCTDDDQDRVPDDRDDCLDTQPAATVDSRGCACEQLDQDQDEVDNCIDECRDTPADSPADARGCSCEQRDQDGDKVDDCDDRCADTAAGELVDEAGCAEGQLDADSDGVFNPDDICPATTEGDEVDAVGCSFGQRDDDKDGMINARDNCPDTIAGHAVDDAGCAHSQIDSDGDEVFDAFDLCLDTGPGATVDAQGCSAAQRGLDELSAGAAVPGSDAESSPSGTGSRSAGRSSGLCGALGMLPLAALFLTLTAARRRHWRRPG